MEKWPGSREAAIRIFRFFDIEYTESDRDGLIVFEGTKWGKRLEIGYRPEFGDVDLFIQFRTRGGRSQGGVIIFKCQDIEMGETPLRDDSGRLLGKHRYVSIGSENSTVMLDKWGVHAEIENIKEY